MILGPFNQRLCNGCVRYIIGIECFRNSEIISDGKFDGNGAAGRSRSG